MTENIVVFSPCNSVHFVGVGGIGMSALAQMCRAAGLAVSGSDRALDNPENKHIFDSLKAQGIKLFPQDGSGVSTSCPDYLIYSTAIEEDNPDFAAGKDIPRLHRSEAMAAAMAAGNQQLIALTGSCGKTTVCAWLAETLYRAGYEPSFLCGGLVKHFISPELTGNYAKGAGEYFVFEADESDKSLLAYAPDYSVVLNIGTDHYSREELVEVFRQFLRQTRKGAVVEKSVAMMLGQECMEHLDITIFDAEESTLHPWDFSAYSSDNGVFCADFGGGEFPAVQLPLPGKHNASNASAVLACFNMLKLPLRKGIDAVSGFTGVWRRFDYAGKLACGARVYDDYAHNVEKIVSCISGARRILNGRVIALFQPHGFGPLKFMRDELFKVLERELDREDIFGLLPVYYAGGTSTFSPSSREVIDDWNTHAEKHYQYFDSRPEAVCFLNDCCQSGDIILIMGARDNSLSSWVAEIACY